MAVGADDHSLQNFSELTPRFPIDRVSTFPPLAAQQAQKSNGETDAGHQRHRLGFLMGQPEVDMATVRQRKRTMVDREVAFPLDAYRKSGAELLQEKRT